MPRVKIDERTIGMRDDEDGGHDAAIRGRISRLTIRRRLVEKGVELALSAELVEAAKRLRAGGGSLVWMRGTLELVEVPA